MIDIASAESVCRSVYENTEEFYNRCAPRMGDASYGYKILYGPPLVHAPILFLGYQPGGGQDAADHGLALGERQSWSLENEYVTAQWPLASRMREVWGNPFLRRCVGLNGLFFRSPNKKEWARLPLQIRQDIEKFCKSQTFRIIDVLRPRAIVMIGFRNIAEFEPTDAPIRCDSSRLIQPGTLWGYPATEIIHLSGARISNDSRGKIAKYFAEPEHTSRRGL